MKSSVVGRIFRIASLAIACFNALLFFAMRPCWSGISKTLGYEKGYNAFIYYLPVYVFVLLLAVAVAHIVFFFALKKKVLWAYIFFPIDSVFTAVIVAVFALGAIDYARYIFFDFANILGVLLVIGIVLFLLFVLPKTPLSRSKVFRFVLIGALGTGCLAAIANFSINAISYEPVVYVVEDTYQIVFSSHLKCLGWVEIGGTSYFDLYAGSEKSTDRVHKISVPQTALDSAKSYTIHAQNFLYRGPFGAFKGYDISKTYSFTPVDLSDGLNYYALSDIHLDRKGAAKAASWDPDLELLVLNGDVVSMLDTHYDANVINRIAFDITGGAKPVLYARGNHEIKGRYAEKLYRYVGSKNEKFYYSFTLGGLYGCVLDWGEDHDDDWWEYYGTADFEDYRKEQIAFLDEEIAKGDFASAQYRLFICHIPLPFINYRKNHVESKKAVVERLNRMDVDMLLAGHQHELFVFEPGQVTPEESPMRWNQAYGGKKYSGYLLDFNFPSLMVSKHGLTQTDDVNAGEMGNLIGMKTVVNFAAKTSKSIYNNSRGEKVHIVNPFSPKDYGDELDIDLTTKTIQ